MPNCGIQALKKISSLSNVSMFTLIHLAKDNGTNLYFCKVEPEELPSVTRPAIFHQKGHFIYIENGEAMPAGEYSGYVLTGRPINEPLPYSLAKKIRGGKKGGGIGRMIVIGLASIINPVLGAVVAGASAAQQVAESGSGEWWRVPIGAATGYLGGVGGTTMGISNSVLAGGLAGAAEIPGAIKSGNWLAPIAAGVGGAMGARFTQGAAGGLAAAPSGVLNKIGGAFKGGVGALTPGGGSAPGTSASGGIELSGGKLISGGASGGIPSSAAYGGNYVMPGLSNSFVPGAQGLQISAMPGAMASGGGASGGSGFDLGKIMQGGTSNISMLGQAASSLMPTPELEGNMVDNYGKASQFLGVDNYGSLPSATREQLNKYTNSSLQDLAKEFQAQDDKGMRILEEKHQQEKSALMTQYANYGQDPMTSSDAQQRLTEIDRQYDQAKAEYAQQGQNQAMEKAIEFKKEMLKNAMQQGQFDINAAMELAQYYGYDQQMKYAIESQNHEALQDVLAQIFSAGTPSQQQPQQQKSGGSGLYATMK